MINVLLIIIISNIHTTYHDDDAFVLICIASVLELAKHYDKHGLVSIYRQHSLC